LAHPKADEQARARFQEKIHAYQTQGKLIIYLDESGFAKDMPRIDGYSPRGQRCFGQQDWQAKGRTNVIGALCAHQLFGVGLFEGPINSDVFHAWVTQVLLPQTPPDAVIVMDNASFHKRQDTQQAICAHHTLEFLPPYSPDLNPIEHKWAQAKAQRRKDRCTVDALFSSSFQ